MIDYRHHFLNTQEVFNRIKVALEEKKPFALIRVGDGEARVLAHDILIPVGGFPSVKLARLKYAGVELPAPDLRKKIINYLKCAELVGLSDVEGPGAYPLIREILESPLIPLYLNDFNSICSAYIHWYLYREGLFRELWQGRRIFLLGRRSEEVAGKVEFTGGEVVGWAKIEGWGDVENCLKEVERAEEFHLALVSAGVPALILCPELARKYRVVAIDFGHLMDYLLEPEGSISRVRISSKKKWDERKREGKK